jgi:hypothetical protein
LHLPGRSQADKSDVLAPKQYNDVLVIETDVMKRAVWRRDCLTADQIRTFNKAGSIFEALVAAFRPVLVGSQAEDGNRYLRKILQAGGAGAPAPESDASKQEPIEPKSWLTPEAQKRLAEELEREKAREKAGTPAQKP